MRLKEYQINALEIIVLLTNLSLDVDDDEYLCLL